MDIYSSDHRGIAKRLKQFRQEAGMTQVDAAAKLKRTQSYVSKVEAGLTDIGVIELKKFSSLYKRKIQDFLE